MTVNFDHLTGWLKTASVAVAGNCLIADAENDGDQEEESKPFDSPLDVEHEPAFVR
jgi:hypothetical protein